MELIELSEFSFEKYRISEVSAIRQRNGWSVCSHPVGRLCNGFVLIIKGECVYRWDDREELLKPGSLIYLPKGSVHSVTAAEKSLEFYRLNFTVNRISDGKEAVFSNKPLIITDSAPNTLHEISSELCRITLSPRTTLKTMSLLCDFIDYCRNFLSHSSFGVDAAIVYINEHSSSKIDVQELANMCRISQSHLFRLFRQKLGVSPVEYKNRLRIKKAKKLLVDPDCCIGEIAELLGFDNACYFTRIFKKHTGQSPTEYRKTHMHSIMLELNTRL